MKLGIDIHGVIDERPEFFKAMMVAMRKDGHQIHILSGPPMPEILADLEKLGIQAGVHYTHVFSIVDHHKALGTPMSQDARGWHMDRYLWDQTKGDYCLKYHIDMHIDDSDVYPYHFKTPYARFFSKDKRKHHIKEDLT
jgi:hypothetical protein